MMPRWIRRTIQQVAFAQALALLLLVGCRKEKARSPVAQVQVDDAIKAKLAKADALDGKADNVIARCALCRFRMDGDAEHSVQVGDYMMQFCGPHCQETFGKDPAQHLSAMVIPEE